MPRPQGWGWAGEASTKWEDGDSPPLPGRWRGWEWAGVGSFGPKVKCIRKRPDERWGRVSLK